MNKKWVRRVSYVLVLASFYFIYATLKKINFQEMQLILSFRWLLAIFLLSLMYAFTGLIRAYNWHGLLDFFSNKKAAFRPVFSIYLKTEIAKYLPSNLVHFAGRHVLLQKLGFSHTQRLLANLFDMGFIAASAFFLALTGVFLGSIPLPDQIIQFLSFKKLLMAGLILAAGVGFLVFKFKNKILDYFKSFLTIHKMLAALKIFLLNVFVFVLSSGILFYIFSALNPDRPDSFSYFHIIAGYALSWLAGFLIPGAPGGLGVREAVMILIFSSVYGTQTALTGGLVLRLVSIFGDIWAFLLGFLLEKNGSKTTSQ